MNQLTMEEIKFLNEKAKNIRIDILKAITKANSGHTGGSLSIADLLTLLFFHEMNINPANPKMENRDRLVISKGHGAPALYAVLAEKGYFSKEELDYMRRSCEAIAEQQMPDEMWAVVERIYNEAQN